MLGEGGNHLPVSPVECPHSVEGPIPVVPPDISNDHNQRTRIKQPYNHHHIYPKNTHIHIQVFHTLYNHTMNIIVSRHFFLF
jgi:hypothetical protein